MNCKSIQELLLTDYVDGEMSDSERKIIDDHLKSCQKCEEFALLAKKVGVDSFSDTERVSPSENVWQRIKMQVSSSSEKCNIFNNIFSLENIKNAFALMRPRLVLASILFVVLSTTLFIKVSEQNLALKQEEQVVVYLATLSEDDDSFDEDFETNIEKYFL